MVAEVDGDCRTMAGGDRMFRNADRIVWACDVTAVTTSVVSVARFALGQCNREAAV